MCRFAVRGLWVVPTLSSPVFIRGFILFVMPLIIPFFGRLSIGEARRKSSFLGSLQHFFEGRTYNDRQGLSLAQKGFFGFFFCNPGFPCRSWVISPRLFTAVFGGLPNDRNCKEFGWRFWGWPRKNTANSKELTRCRLPCGLVIANRSIISSSQSVNRGEVVPLVCRQVRINIFSICGQSPE